MKPFKIRLIFFIFLMIITLSSCFDTPPCDVSYYYMSPSKITLFKDIPDTSYFNNIFLLTSVMSDSLFVDDSTYSNDTLIISKKMIINKSCNLLVNSQNNKLNQGDTLFFGNDLVGGNFATIKYSCDNIDISQESVELTIWIKRFTQDCSNW